MFLRFEAMMTGLKFSDIAPELFLVDIIEEPPVMDLMKTRMANKPGERVSAKTRTSLSVRLVYEIHSLDIARRAEIQRLVAKWAYGYNGSGLLAVNYRPGKVLNVACDNLPTLDSSLKWTQRLSFVLTAHEVPYWEDEIGTTKDVTAKLDANGDYTTLLEYMTADGDFNGVPVDVYAANPWEGNTLTKLTVTIGNTTFVLDGLSVAPGDFLVIEHRNGVVKIRPGSDDTVSYLQARMPESSDELLADLGRNNVYIKADSGVTVTLSYKGRWM